MSSILIVVTSHGEIETKPTTGIWFSEFLEPIEVFRSAGMAMTVASPRGGPAPIDPRGYPSREEIADARDALALLNATLRLDTIRADAFDALFFPGGHGPMFDLAGDPRIKQLIADFWQSNKVVGAVCHGPAALLKVTLPGGVTLLKGKRVTGFTQSEDAVDALFQYMPFSLQEAMAGEGAHFVEMPPRSPHVEVDGRLVTGQNPASAVVTARAFVETVQAGGSSP